MKNNVENIMKRYKEEIEKIDKKYEVEEVKMYESLDTKEVDLKIKYEEEFIEKLKAEGENNNKDLIVRSTERLESLKNEKQKIEEKNSKAEEIYKKDIARREEKVLDNNKLKNSMVKLESGREVTMVEKDRLDKVSLKDNAIRELTQENKSISKEILNKKQELEAKREEWRNFKYEFDENHNITNKDVVEKIHEEVKKLSKELEELTKIQEECDKYLTELKMPTKEDKNFSDAWNSAYKEETKSGSVNPGATNSQGTKSEETKSGQVNPGPTNPGPVNPGPTSPGPVNPGPTNPGLTNPGPVNPGPTNPGLTNPGPVNPGPINPELAVYNPKKISGIKPQIKIDAKTGKLYYNDGKREHEPVNIGYPKKYWKDEHILSVLENIDNKFDVKMTSLAKACDPNIINLLEENPERLEEYVLSIYNDEPFPFKVSYNLEGMHSVDFLTNKEKSYLSRTARKAEMLGAEVKRDSLFERAKGWIKSHISKATRNKAVEEKKKQMLGKGMDIYSSKEKQEIMEFVGTKNEFLKYCNDLKEKGYNMDDLKSVIYTKLSHYKTEESNNENKFKGALKVGKEKLSKVHHYTSEKLNKSKLLNNVKMNAKIATTKISGFFKGENPLKTYSKVQNIKDDYMSR